MRFLILATAIFACATAAYSPAAIASILGGGNQANEAPASSGNVQKPEVQGHVINAPQDLAWSASNAAHVSSAAPSASPVAAQLHASHGAAAPPPGW